MGCGLYADEATRSEHGNGLQTERRSRNSYSPGCPGQRLERLVLWIPVRCKDVLLIDRRRCAGARFYGGSAQRVEETRELVIPAGPASIGSRPFPSVPL